MKAMIAAYHEDIRIGEHLSCTRNTCICADSFIGTAIPAAPFAATLFVGCMSVSKGYGAGFVTALGRIGARWVRFGNCRRSPDRYSDGAGGRCGTWQTERHRRY